MESVKRVIREGWNEEMFDKMDAANMDDMDTAAKGRINRAKDYLAHRYLRDNEINDADVMYMDRAHENPSLSAYSSKQLKALSDNYKDRQGNIKSRKNLKDWAAKRGDYFANTPDMPDDTEMSPWRKFKRRFGLGY